VDGHVVERSGFPPADVSAPPEFPAAPRFRHPSREHAEWL